MSSFLTANATSPREAQRLAPEAFIHGYHVAFFWGAMLFVAAFFVSLLLIHARKDQVPADAGGVPRAEPVD